MLVQYKNALIVLVAVSFIGILTTGCAHKQITQVDPPSLQLDDVAWSGTDRRVTDSKNTDDKWQVKQTSSRFCQVLDPATGKWYDATVDKDGKVEFSKELIKKMGDDRQEFWSKNHDAFMDWLDKHPEQKEKHEAWKKNREKALKMGSDGGGGGGGGGGGNGH